MEQYEDAKTNEEWIVDDMLNRCIIFRQILAKSTEFANKKICFNRMTFFSLLLVLIIIYIISSPLELLKLKKNADASTTRKDCIHYSPLEKVIIINCKSSNLSDIYTALDDSSVLAREKNGSWILNANMRVKDDAKLFINSSDTNWLKINSPDKTAYHIQVEGSMQIDSTKITGWDTETNTFPETDSKGNHPRSFIEVLDYPVAKEGSNPHAKTDITDSEIAYLGYNESNSFGLVYYSGNGSMIKGNNIHNLWYGFYSANYEGRVFNITVANNYFYNNSVYGIDPHTGTHHLVIRNNTVFDNGKHGIICSQHCYDITIEDNTVFGNGKTGIMLDENVTRSIIRNNTIRDNVVQIAIQNISNSNKVYYNQMEGGRIGIEINNGSASNIVRNNDVTNVVYGIYLPDPDAGDNNKINSNNITNASGLNIYKKIY